MSIIHAETQRWDERHRSAVEGKKQVIINVRARVGGLTEKYSLKIKL